jgi:isoleucyl-tRNA synthetase
MSFAEVKAQPKFPEMEEETLRYWKKHTIFEKSVESRPADKTWTFLDGPPFVTGMPHYGHLLTSIPKDIFPRFWTMKGYRVRRVWGWDCHGLPAENKVENKLGLKRKRDIEEQVGVKKFIEECKAYVGDVSAEWEWYIDHIARWVDYKNAYRTMDTDYMESVMWVFKQLYDKQLIYKGLRVSLYCPHCSTPISNFEVALDNSYKEVNEPSNVYKYQLQDEHDTYFLAWSTTPWNKLVTPALAVNLELEYVKVKQGKEKFILAQSTLEMLLDTKYEILDMIPGKDLVGMKFVPHFKLYPDEPGKRRWEVIPGGFVTAEEGTGIVTIAAYGDEDLQAMKEHNVQVDLHVNDEGMIDPEVERWGGKYYLKVNDEVNLDLQDRGLMYREDDHPHRVPVCWRCDTRLFHNPQNAWYVDIQQIKGKLEQANEEINWFPNHFKHGRFLNSLRSAPDWCISRSRYWGSPVPVWECDCGERVVPGSIDELEALSGTKITDLHKPEIDAVTIPCPKCGQDTKRVTEVLDSWIEAGSAAFAERHFPFSGDKLEDFFPPDYIVEYTGQIRAWFYVLHVIAVALYDSPAFKNVQVNGVILGTDGRKMSKNYGNYPDPKQLLQQFGGDALRLYLMGNPVMNGEDMIISEENYRHQVRGYLIVLWNCFKFFVTYANLDTWSPSISKEMSKRRNVETNNVLDQWMLSKLHRLNEDITEAYEQFDTVKVVKISQEFVSDLSNWYVRRSRDRVGQQVEDSPDKQAFYQTNYQVLIRFCQLTAPLTPFVSEAIYRHLTQAESVHLTDWPEADKVMTSDQLEADMSLVRKIVERGHAARKQADIPVRQPLQSIEVSVANAELSLDLQQLIKDELNVKQVVWKSSKQVIQPEVSLDTQISPKLEAEGQARQLIRKLQMARRKAGCDLTEQVEATLPDWPKAWEQHIKTQALIKELSRGKKISVIRSM